MIGSVISNNVLDTHAEDSGFSCQSLDNLFLGVLTSRCPVLDSTITREFHPEAGIALEKTFPSSINRSCKFSLTLVRENLQVLFLHSKTLLPHH